LDQRFVDSIYSGATEARPWREFLNQLCDICRGQAVSFILRMPGLGESGLVFSSHADTHYERRYLTRFAHLTPFQQQPINRAIRIDDLMSREQLVASEFYQGLLAPAATEFILGMNVASAHGDISLITVSRTRAQGNFGVLEKQLLEGIAEHLSRALSIYIRFHDLSRERAVFSDALDQLGIGTIVLNKEGNFLCANTTATQLLDEKSGLTLRANRVRAQAPADSAQLEQLIESALTAYRARDFAQCDILKVTLAQQDRHLHVLVRPSIHPAAIENSEAPAVCIFISYPGNAVMQSADVIRKLFGFTRAEGTEVRLLLEGLMPKEIAHQLDISLSTVRTHIKSIFTKAGVGRQSELVSSVLRSIALLA
jgi:DNA-binding CsgD family transcriptional regulator